jgi:hypothetical protein
VLRIRDGEQRLQAPQHPVAAPILGQLDCRTGEVTRETLELLFELLEQGERVGRGACEPGQHLPPGEFPHLVGVRLHDGIADRHLSVPAHRHLPVPVDAQDRRGAKWCRLHHALG